jgi:hypothetical protein
MHVDAANFLRIDDAHALVFSLLNKHSLGFHSKKLHPQD